jgi:hypothetical protein
VSDVRSALADAERRIVKTVARRGYLFAAPVSALAQNWPDGCGAERPMAAEMPRLLIVMQPVGHFGGDGELAGLVGAIDAMLATGLWRLAWIQKPASATEWPDRRLTAVGAADVA